MTTAKATREETIHLLELALAGSIDPGVFSSDFEELFNFRLDRTLFSTDELAALNRLFDVVVWYSPFADERRQYPHHYKDGAAVTEAVSSTLAALRQSD